MLLALWKIDSCENLWQRQAKAALRGFYSSQAHDRRERPLWEGRASYLRTADGLEVDLLVETAQGYVAAEIKQSAGVSRHDARHLLRLDGILDKPILCRLVVSQHPNVAVLGENTYGVPAAWLMG